MKTKQQKLEFTLKNAIKSGNKSRAAWAIVELERLNEAKKQLDNNLPSLFECLEKQILGVTDEVTTCFCCNKTNLKKTVVFRIKDEYVNQLGTSTFGEFFFFGTTCATNFIYSGKGQKNTKNINKKIELSQLREIKLTAIYKGAKIQLQWLGKYKSILFIAANNSEKWINEKDLDSFYRLWHDADWQGNKKDFIDAIKVNCPSLYSVI